MKSNEYLRIPDPQGLHIIDRQGDLLWLQPPFPVTCNKNMPGITAHEVVYVEQVAFTPEDEIVFVIGDLPYHYYHFDITTSF